MLFLGFYSAGALDRVRIADSESSRIYLLRHDRLDAVRASAYLASSRVRDYLVDPDPDAYQVHRQQAREEWQRMRDSFDKYRQVAAPGRASLIGALTASLDAYWDKASKSFELSDADRRNRGFDLLTVELGPGRERFLAALDALRNEDLSELRDAIAETAGFLDALQTRLSLVIAFSLLLGVVLAAFSWRYVAKLEGEVSRRLEESLAAAAQLEQLSHRLLSVQEEERRRLARELHDEVGQCLGAMLVDLGQARSATASNNVTVAETRLKSAADLAERTLRSVRDISLLLRPSMLDDLGLIPALHWQARETSRRTGVNVTFEADEEELEVHDELRTAVYRVVQEALQNSVRHAEARRVQIGLASGGGRLRILVKDDGKGFDPAVTRGMGILGMQERIAQFGGTLRINSTPGNGTVLTVDVPLETTAAHPASEV